MTGRPIIGVLALQGAVDLHRPHIEAAGAQFKAVKTPKDFEVVDAFILPGGESTTMLKLIERFSLWDSLAENFAAKPVWGICAGSILMAEKVLNPAQKSFALLPITVQRNAYGTQKQSHTAQIDGYDVSFIRAPVIQDVDPSVEVLARHNGDPVWVKKGQYMATTFHPELTLDFPSPMHKAFVEMI
ncbi:MAG: pyridoxal 5'-phosphate synthase glutaminase subunit PdxT [Alphaproteobacteria bacterium]|nr:pyridoxal 5'-phosphate synthase glutaminase subunit PdxT [Alphaproteobacteria bacterium]